MIIISVVAFLVEEILEEIVILILNFFILKPILQLSKRLDNKGIFIKMNNMKDKKKLISFRCPVLNIETLCIYYNENTNLISFEKNVSEGEMERLQVQGYVDKGIYLEKFCFDFTLKQAEQISKVLKQFIELNSNQNQ
jgi:hypothetical protein